MDQGSAVPPQAAEEDAKRAAAHAHKAAEDLRSAAGATEPMNIGPAGKKYGMMRSIVSAVFRTTASNTSARSQRRRSLRHLGLVSCLG